MHEFLGFVNRNGNNKPIILCDDQIFIETFMSDIINQFHIIHAYTNN